MKMNRLLVNRMKNVGLSGLVLCLLLLVSCVTKESDSSKLSRNAPRDMHGLKRVFWVSEQIISGGQPDGEEGFRTLADLGVKTLVSVDGARPQVEIAKSLGMRYIHIPVGYDGIHEVELASLSRVIRDAEPPYYIHCHHGQHRGPAAAAIAYGFSGQKDSDQLLEVLRNAGTGEGYNGLWQAVRTFNPDKVDVKLAPLLYESAPVDSYTVSMAQIDRIWDNLKLCRRSEWSVPSDHPDIDPAHEALMLEEGFRESGRQAKGLSKELINWLQRTELEASALKEAVKAGNKPRAEKYFKSIKASCTKCHRKFRE